MTTTPPEDPRPDPDPGAGDHDPTVRFGATPPPPPPPPPAAGWAVPGAPYGVDPKTGLPYSDKSKIVAGLLQLLIPLGIGRMYTGHTSMGVAQLLVTLFTCGIGAVWPFIDGIILLVSDPRDANGRPLRS
ncbi:NINE protein [Aeromicrobium sp. 636]|uniref:TM2 domain-containing protein n=1 Tax=Aeromicrobium senzhongii TaxID=2663859 RepID=A0A8I0K1U9_9ACTN|nr:MULTISPECIES: TM2 domain-containing protein [Aeromicrobium]MBC9225354.1 TM2 domain-containing protein [Aeromicrobium senzhongii]MCQ3997464.1 NINE protein [Aeromicrobium sp. 636]